MRMALARVAGAWVWRKRVSWEDADGSARGGRTHFGRAKDYEELGKYVASDGEELVLCEVDSDKVVEDPHASFDGEG